MRLETGAWLRSASGPRVWWGVGRRTWLFSASYIWPLAVGEPFKALTVFGFIWLWCFWCPSQCYTQHNDEFYRRYFALVCGEYFGWIKIFCGWQRQWSDLIAQKTSAGPPSEQFDAYTAAQYLYDDCRTVWKVCAVRDLSRRVCRHFQEGAG